MPKQISSPTEYAYTELFDAIETYDDQLEKFIDTFGSDEKEFISSDIIDTSNYDHLFDHTKMIKPLKLGLIHFRPKTKIARRIRKYQGSKTSSLIHRSHFRKKKNLMRSDQNS